MRQGYCFFDFFVFSGFHVHLKAVRSTWYTVLLCFSRFDASNAFICIICIHLHTEVPSLREPELVLVFIQFSHTFVDPSRVFVFVAILSGHKTPAARARGGAA